MGSRADCACGDTDGGAMVKPLGVGYIVHHDAITVGGIYAKMTWNCIGWQSLLLFLISAIVGLSGGYSLGSKTEVVAIGLLGTILVNLVRMATIVIILNFSQPLFAVVFHDYLAAIVTIMWLFVFWWFSYAFVLVPQKGVGRGMWALSTKANFSPKPEATLEKK